MHIGGAGYANLLPAYSVLYAINSSDAEENLRNGNVVVGAREELLALTEQEAAEKLYAVVSPYLSLSAMEAKSRLDLTFPSHIRFHNEDSVIANVQNFTLIPVGQIRNSSCRLNSTIHYLGNSTTFAHLAPASIPVSGNFAETLSWASWELTLQ